jgi:hypothetical protein
MEELFKFIVQAKINTYAGDGALSESSRPSSKDLYYKSGDYSYIDSYFGEINFIGQEVVFYKNWAVWGMNYFGEMLNDAPIPEGFSECLKGALSLVTELAPYRGPESFAIGDFKYSCFFEGEFESFYGEETISYKGEDIYFLKFHGGMTKYN